MPLDSNIIGNIGENTVALRLSKFGIFNVYFLGEKAPISDFLLEINDDATPFHALVQVKATETAPKYTVKGRMKTPIPTQKLYKLIDRPLPTYVAGADIDAEVVFIAPAFDKKVKYSSSIPPLLKIDNINLARSKQHLEKLRDDIINYWRTTNAPTLKPTYQTIL